jgi:hypothetical protein
VPEKLVRTRPPQSGAIALRLPWLPSARLATPVLVVAALLAGAAIGSLVFATLWQREASSRETAQAQLASSRSRVADLRAGVRRLQLQLDASAKTAASAGRAAKRGSEVVAGLAQSAKPLVATAGSLESQASTLTQRASSLSGLIATLDKDLASLSRYVGDGGSLDPAFLKTQLGYLTPSLDRVGSASAALAGEVSTYASTVQAFVDRLATYAKSIRAPATP